MSVAPAEVLTLGRIRELTQGLPDDLPLCIISASFHVAAICQVGISDDVESALREPWTSPLPATPGLVFGLEYDSIDDWATPLR